jgi:hypothetical protein
VAPLWKPTIRPSARSARPWKRPRVLARMIRPTARKIAPKPATPAPNTVKNDWAGDFTAQPRPIYGIPVAITVMKSTFASSGRPAM